MIKEGVGKHSARSSGAFWRTLFLSILKWLAISVIPIAALVGGWNWLSGRTPPPEDNPAIVATDPARSPSPEPSPTAGQAAQILNGGSDSQLLQDAKKKLEDAGYEILTTGNTSRPYDKTTVFFQQGSRSQADELARLAGATVTRPAPDNLDKNIPLTLVIGADFQP